VAVNTCSKAGLADGGGLHGVRVEGLAFANLAFLGEGSQGNSP